MLKVLKEDEGEEGKRKRKSKEKKNEIRTDEKGMVKE